MSEKTSVAVGLKNIHYAIITSDDSTGTVYGTPKRLSLALTAKVTPSINSATLNAEDGPVITANELGEIAVEIGVTNIPYEISAELLGQTLNEDGVLIDNADDIAPEVALGYERTMDDGTSKFTWLLKGKFQLPEEDAATKSGTPAFQTDVIKGVFLKRKSDGNWRFRLDSGMTEAKPEVLAAWFTQVYSGIPTP